MNAAALLLILVAKTFFLGLPVGVAWLAFRRLVLSETLNAWIYAGVGLFAAFTAAGLTPWAFGFQPTAWMFLVFGFLCPPLWLATVVLCGMGRISGYDVPKMDVDDTSLPVQASAEVQSSPRVPPAPLLLEQPIWPKPEKAVFRTHRTLLREARKMASERMKAEPIDRSVLDVARSMRGNSNTTKRRMRPLLPPPHAISEFPNLPFLQR